MKSFIRAKRQSVINYTLAQNDNRRKCVQSIQIPVIYYVIHILHEIAY